MHSYRYGSSTGDIIVSVVISCGRACMHLPMHQAPPVGVIIFSTRYASPHAPHLEQIVVTIDEPPVRHPGQCIAGAIEHDRRPLQTIGLALGCEISTVATGRDEGSVDKPYGVFTVLTATMNVREVKYAPPPPPP